MLLTSKEIADRGIVVGSVAASARATTYDATVGAIACKGRLIQQETYTLPPRGIVWVVSAESFEMPDDVTGLATLRTTWTHKGVLALNVGIVDPGHIGPLSTAVVNFGNADFEIKKRDAFFRIMFQDHGNSVAKSRVWTNNEYISDTIDKSRLFSSSFLNMEKIADEVSDLVLKLPRWAYILSFIGILVAVVAIFTPIAWAVTTDYGGHAAKIESLQRQVDELKSGQNTSAVTSERLAKLEGRLDGVRQYTGRHRLPKHHRH